MKTGMGSSSSTPPRKRVRSLVSKMKVDDLSGTVANGLRLAGEADTVGGRIDGTYSINVDLDPTDTIDDLISKLEDAKAPISATVLNTGDGNKPWFLSLTSDISGAAGDLVINTRWCGSWSGSTRQGTGCSGVHRIR